MGLRRATYRRLRRWNMKFYQFVMTSTPCWEKGFRVIELWLHQIDMRLGYVSMQPGTLAAISVFLELNSQVLDLTA